MDKTYETKNKEQGMSDPNENKPGYKKTKLDWIPAGYIISNPVADAIDFSIDAMHGVYTPKIVYGYCQYAIYSIYAVTVRCRDAMHRVSTNAKNRQSDIGYP